VLNNDGYNFRNTQSAMHGIIKKNGCLGEGQLPSVSVGGGRRIRDSIHVDAADAQLTWAL
jgi:hypothetical protein